MIQTTVGQESTRSICPKGWRLPIDPNSVSSAKTATYAGLKSAYNIGTDGSKFTKAPLYFVYNGNVFNDTLYGTGKDGYYWSSTASGETKAYGLGFNSTNNVTTSSSNERYFGFAIRCVAR